jgi:hypothetical protein
LILEDIELNEYLIKLFHPDSTMEELFYKSYPKIFNLKSLELNLFFMKVG